MLCLSIILDKLYKISLVKRRKNYSLIKNTF